MTTGEKILKLRKERNLTQKELALLVGSDRSTISLYESNKRDLTKERITQFSHIFHVPVTYFFDEPQKDTYTIFLENLDKITYDKLIAIIKDFNI